VPPCCQHKDPTTPLSVETQWIHEEVPAPPGCSQLLHGKEKCGLPWQGAQDNNPLKHRNLGHFGKLKHLKLSNLPMYPFRNHQSETQGEGTASQFPTSNMCQIVPPQDAV